MNATSLFAPGSASWNGMLAGEGGTMALGAALARAGLRRGAVYLAGELGTGKTTLVRGFLRASGVIGTIRSPTFTLVEEYRIGAMTVGHYDLYRLSDPEELEFLGLRDHLAQGALCFFEWPERGSGVLPEPGIEIRLEHPEKGRRTGAADVRRVRCTGLESGARSLLERALEDFYYSGNIPDIEYNLLK